MSEPSTILFRTNVANEALNRMSIVSALYHVLCDAYVCRFGSDTGLLPCYNGWCYSPIWLSPRPLCSSALATPNFSKERPIKQIVYSLAWADEQREPSYEAMRVILKRITERAWIMRRRRADELLTHAIEQAKKDISLAENILFELAEGLENLHKEILYADAKDALALLEAQEEAKVHLLRVRLHWLETWHEIEHSIWKKSPTGTEVSAFGNLIKPKDVDDAIEAMQLHIFGRSEQERKKIIGQWYATVLMRCGAGWRDLREIRKKLKSPSQSKKYSEWSDVINQKLWHYNKSF